MKRKSDQRVKVFFYILLTFVFILTSVGISFASERSIRSISVPHRDVDITLNPGGNQQFSRNEILDFQADAVELEVTGNNQFITVELDSMVNNENDTLQVHTWYKLFSTIMHQQVRNMMCLLFSPTPPGITDQYNRKPIP